jgi:hypothetical protein
MRLTPRQLPERKMLGEFGLFVNFYLIHDYYDLDFDKCRAAACRVPRKA